MKKRNNFIYYLFVISLFFHTFCTCISRNEQRSIFFHQKRNFVRACDYYTKALHNNPYDINLLYNASLAFNELGNFDESQQCLEKIMQKQPLHKNAQRKLVLHYLRKKEWEKASPYLSVDDYWWYNRDITNKNILIRHDGGFGDAIQFMRYAKRLHEAGAHVIVETPAPLIPLFSRCPFINTLIPLGNPLPSIDKEYIVSTPRLAFIMKESLDKPSIDIPYLTPDPKLVAYWQEKLSHDTNFKIGLCWQSSMMRNQTGAVVANPRSIPLKKLAPLGQIPGISFYSLQKINGVDQLHNLPFQFVIHTFGAYFDQSNGRFMDTAAVMKNLDLIITVDTATAHLAGALDVPVWVMLPTTSDFRWFLDCTDSPWYPTMHLLRQQQYNNWDTVVQKMVYTLQKHIQKKIANNYLPLIIST